MTVCGGRGWVLSFKKTKQKLDNFQFLSVFVNADGSVKQDINNIKNRQQRPQNNVEHKMLANIVDQIKKQTTHIVITIKKASLRGHLTIMQ